ncbi:MAG TPA: MBL fold metallo-hydrolase [Bacillota bacterium]
MKLFRWWMICFVTFYVMFPQEVTYSKNIQEMKVHFIDVGQGDSIFIQTPNDKHILIDGGRPESGKRVVAYLKQQQVKTIDLMIATHPDIDHIGGLPYVMKHIQTNEILDSGKTHTTKTYGRYVREIHKQNIPVTIAQENKTIKIDPLLQIRILNTYGTFKNNNQSSIVLHVNYDEVDFLFMSDIEHKQEKDLLSTYDLRANVIKIAHHGSKTSSSMKFLQQVNPNIAILTYSKQNDFGHPVKRVIHNLNRVHAHIYSTAVFGDLVIWTEGKNYYVFPKKNPINGILEEKRSQ